MKTGLEILKAPDTTAGEIADILGKGHPPFPSGEMYGICSKVSCRKNREPQHKRNFEGLFWAYLVGINDRAIVEIAEEPKTTKR